MLLDIVIAISAALMQGITAFMGWYVTINPLVPGNPKYGRKKRIYTGLFIFVGLAGVFLVGLAAYRSPKERAHLAIMPAATYEQSGIPPSWSNGAVFLQLNRELAFNIVYQNVGTGSAINIMSRAHAFMEPNISRTSEDDVLSQFDRMKASEPLNGSFTLGKGFQEWTTAHGAILSPEDRDNLISGRRVVYLAAEFSYFDDSGNHIRHYCQSLPPSQEGDNLIWANCARYNDEE